MSTKEILVNGKPEIAYAIVGTGKTVTCDYLHDGNIHKVQDEIREQEVWRIIFRNWAVEIAPALSEETVLTLDNIARVDYGKYPGDEEKKEKKIPPFNINHWWIKFELILPNGNRNQEDSGGLPPIKPLTAQEKALVEQIIAQSATRAPTKADIKRAKRNGRRGGQDPKDGQEKMDKAIKYVLEKMDNNKITLTQQKACVNAIKEFSLNINWEGLMKQVRSSPKWKTLKKKIEIARRR